MGCTSGAMKCMLNIMNVLMALFGIGVISLAAFIVYTAPPVYVIYLFVIGSVTLIASILGCCGICQESVCMTTTYAALILASLLTQLIGKFYASDSDSIRRFAAEDVEKTWLKELDDPAAMDRIQQTYHCCGKNGPGDYDLINRHEYPDSCYPQTVYNSTLLYTTGCIPAAQENFLQIFNYSSSGEWGNLIFTAIMFVFAACLVSRFRKKKQRYNY